MKTVLSPCIFCLEEQHHPHWLPCAHSFCSDCLQRYLVVRGDLRCPLCRREFQVSAEASNDSHTAPDSHHRVVVPAAMSATQPSAIEDANVRTTEHHLHQLFELDFDRLNDTLMLTLTEQEIRFFANLYGEVVREDHSQTSGCHGHDWQIDTQLSNT
ncbi:tripartite motif-containing protein 3 [Drosophila sulfurigaster albostrigata]|uniref:tripartite motif-containing protein 3 n=1 Tax=Drosophila sulfurigaster albostrigata TaxID=89887 RepID=UPI002D21A709|nr:tripartite motif-containing protein 3 [Drosophila sulfurigaster albostrigata]